LVYLKNERLTEETADQCKLSSVPAINILSYAYKIISMEVFQKKRACENVFHATETPQASAKCIL
jgi:hypothetical protein